MFLVFINLPRVFPKKELYGLTSQFRCATVSIRANIAEGYKKSGNAYKAKFMNIAQLSLEECQYYLILLKDLNIGKRKNDFSTKRNKQNA